MRFRKYRRKVKFYFYLACADKPWCENFPFCKDSQALRDRIVGDCPIQCKELRCKAYWKDDVTESDPVAPEDAPSQEGTNAFWVLKIRIGKKKYGHFFDINFFFQKNFLKRKSRWAKPNNLFFLHYFLIQKINPKKKPQYWRC